MLNADELQSGLAQFTSTEQWHRYSPLFRQLLLTDGAKFLCENAECYWLADAIASHVFTNRAKLSPQVNPFQAWRLERLGNGAILTCTDGGKEGRNPTQLVRQDIEYTDFPLDQVDLWCIWDAGIDPKGSFVLMLPSEY